MTLYDNDRPLSFMSASQEGLYTLFVRPVNQASEETLRKTFSQFGEVEDIYIPRDYVSKRRRPFAYIKYTSKFAASDAIEKLNNTELNGKVISVVWSEEKSKTPQEMVTMKEQKRKERQEELRYTPEEHQKFLEEKNRQKELYEKYFTVVNYPYGVGEAYTPEYQKGLKPVGERKTFYSWVYLPEEKIIEVLQAEKQHEHEFYEKKKAVENLTID